MDYLKETNLLNYQNDRIEALINERQWKSLPPVDRIRQAYNYVRDEVRFGYNTDDAIPASQVLADGYGQCNTKGILLMALLKALAISCSMHGFMIDKKMQKGAVKGIFYKLAPDEIVHSWVEVEFEGKWYNLEGFILDSDYLHQLQNMFSTESSFCGYGAATNNLANPPIDWNINDTYIQKEGFTHNLMISLMLMRKT